MPACVETVYVSSLQAKWILVSWGPEALKVEEREVRERHIMGYVRLFFSE